MCPIVALMSAATLNAQAEDNVWNITSANVIYYSGPSFSQEGAYDFNIHFGGDQEWGYPMMTFEAYMPEPQLTSGTYTLSDGTIKDVHAARFDGDSPWVSSMTLQITDNGNSNYTFDADLMVSGDHITFSYTADVDVIEDDYDQYEFAYAFESHQKSQIDFVAEQMTLNDIALNTQRQIELDMTSSTCPLANTVKLCINTDKGVMPEGVYPICPMNETTWDYDLYTVLASLGSYDNYSLFPSYVAQMTDGVADAAWFLVSGNMTVAYPAEGQISIHVEAKSAFGSDVNIVYEGAFDYEEHVPTTYDITLDPQGYFLDCTWYNHMTFTGDGITALIDIFANSFVGSFDCADGTINQWQSGIIDANGRGYNLVEGTATITATAVEGIYDVEATLKTDNGDTYLLHGQNVRIDNGCYNLDEHVDYEGTFATNLNGFDAWEAESAGNIILTATNDEGQGLQLLFKVNGADAETVLPLGEYVINDSGDPGTVMASPGQTGMGVDPSWVANCDQYLSIDNVWFLASGTVNTYVEGQNIVVDIDALNTVGAQVKATVYVAMERNLDFDENSAFEGNWRVADAEMQNLVDELGVIDLTAYNADRSETAVIRFVTNAWDDETGIPAGEYHINGSGEPGTVLASTGFDDTFNPTASFAATCTPTGFMIQLWFLTEGTVTVTNVNGQPRIVIDGRNSFHRPVSIVLEPEQTVSLQTLGNSLRDGKAFRNGKLVITRNGVSYDVTGQLVK